MIYRNSSALLHPLLRYSISGLLNNMGYDQLISFVESSHILNIVLAVDCFTVFGRGDPGFFSENLDEIIIVRVAHGFCNVF